jgi:hypothetical protein
MTDWRLDEEDEPEASFEEVFGTQTQDRLTAALERVKDLARDADAETLDRELVDRWVRRASASGNVEEAERFADYLAA